MRRIYVPVLAALMLALSTAESVAQTGPDYVFNVPVRIENAPGLNGRSVAVSCAVQAYNSSGGWLATPDARQSVDVGPTGYTGTLRMEITLPPGVARSNVVRWHCNLIPATVVNPSGAVVSLPGANSEAKWDNYPTVTGQSIARRNTHAGADFPR